MEFYTISTKLKKKLVKNGFDYDIINWPYYIIYHDLFI